MTTNKLITSDDPKGLQTTDLFRTVYNKAYLTDEQAQRLNNIDSKFASELLQLIQKHSSANQYANEIEPSSYNYPKEYKGPKPIVEQIETIAKMFELDEGPALEFIKTLPELPDGAEGWFAIPKVSAVAKKHFPAITDQTEQYCKAVKLVHKKLNERRDFTNYKTGEIVPNKLRVHARTVGFLEVMEYQQQGDILIIAAQYGMKHRGKSVRYARETFASNEFGLTTFALMCMALVHPKRYVQFEELDTDCTGDEFNSDTDDVIFLESPILSFGDGELKLDTGYISDAFDYCGSASGFVPQKFLL